MKILTSNDFLKKTFTGKMLTALQAAGENFVTETSVHSSYFVTCGGRKAACFTSALKGSSRSRRQRFTEMLRFRFAWLVLLWPFTRNLLLIFYKVTHQILIRFIFPTPCCWLELLSLKSRLKSKDLQVFEFLVSFTHFRHVDSNKINLQKKTLQVRFTELTVRVLSPELTMCVLHRSERYVVQYT